MKVLRYALVVITLLVFAAACATPPEDEPVEIPDNVTQLREQAMELRATIDQYELDAYEQEETALGDTAFERGDGFLEEDPASAADAYEEAIARYEVAISRGFSALLADRQTEVEGVRQDAIDARARTAASAMFEDAEEVFARAVELREAESFEESLATFADAEERFADSREVAIRRREEARTALDRLDERLREAESDAVELERQLREETEIELEEEEL